MIHYTLIIRSRDGMALSVSTDCTNDVDKTMKEVKRYMKLIAKKTMQFPERCSMKVGTYVIHFVTSLGISYLVLCDITYPAVLAFSFINELMQEFLSRYDTRRVNEVRRPYSFIEFDSLIMKSRQRYNRPQSLTTRVQLAEFSKELKLRPPHLISSEEVEPPSLPNGLHRNMALTNVSVGTPRKLKPLSFYGVIAWIVSLIFALLNLYRAVNALSESSIEEYDGPSPTHGFLFLFEGMLQLCQVFLLLRLSKFRNLEAGLSLFAMILCGVLLWDIRETWLASSHLLVATLATLAIFRQPFEEKSPNYNV